MYVTSDRDRELTLNFHDVSLEMQNFWAMKFERH
jgi:hypothetical protein